MEVSDDADFVRGVIYNITHESSLLFDKIEKFKDDKDFINVIGELPRNIEY